jgi:hypothetical protein
VVQRSGCHAAAILDDVAIFDRAPGPAPDIESLRSGLDTLKRHFEVLDRRTGATGPAGATSGLQA